jgi:hypothetical protein
MRRPAVLLQLAGASDQGLVTTVEMAHEQTLDTHCRQGGDHNGG